MLRDLLTEDDAPAVLADRRHQCLGDGADAAFQVGDAAAGQVQGGGGVQGVGVLAGGLGGDEQLGVDELLQVWRSVAQVGSQRSKGIL